MVLFFNGDRPSCSGPLRATLGTPRGFRVMLLNPLIVLGYLPGIFSKRLDPSDRRLRS